MTRPSSDTTNQILCLSCQKPTDVCICNDMQPVPHTTQVVVLQHPQEKTEILGTASMLQSLLSDSVLKIGLSWPGLSRILGRDVDLKRWGVLYLGTLTKGGTPMSSPLLVTDKNGQPLAEQDRIVASLEGVIVLDGTWAQAKTLWWRNPWLLKAQRIVLTPTSQSLYGSVRREPRKNSLSTLEAVAFALSHLEKRPELFDQMTSPLKIFVEKYQAKYGVIASPHPRKKGPFRRRRGAGGKKQE